MLKKSMLAGVCALGLMSASAYAQTAAVSSASAPSFVTKQSTDQWRASKLPGVDVYSNTNEKIGSIDDILLDAQGNAKVAVIGVGGFLGIGQKDVAVPYASLQWRNEAEGRTAASASGGATANPAVDAAQRGYPDHAVLNATKDQLQNAPTFAFASDTKSTGAGGPATMGGAPANSTH